MTSVRQIQLIANAGHPDSVLARRIDVVNAAVKLVEAWHKFGTKSHVDFDMPEHKLEVAVRRYKGAVRTRGKAP